MAMKITRKTISFTSKMFISAFLIRQKKSRHITFTLHGGPTKLTLQKSETFWTHCATFSCVIYFVKSNIISLKLSLLV